MIFKLKKANVQRSIGANTYLVNSICKIRYLESEKKLNKLKDTTLELM